MRVPKDVTHAINPVYYQLPVIIGSCPCLFVENSPQALESGFPLSL
jgi:hypothetical protein